MMNDDFYNEENTSFMNGDKSSMNVHYDPKDDEKKQKEHEQKNYKKILQRFRVISPDEINQMMKEGRPMNMHNNNQNFNQNTNASSADLTNLNSNGKIRSRDEMMTGARAGQGPLPLNL